MMDPSSHPVEPLEIRIAPAFAAAIELGALNAFDGFVLNGAAPDDSAGFAVSNAGDVNGDGLADFLVGAYGADSVEDDTGAAYLVLGSADGFPARFELAALDGSNGFGMKGEAEGDYAGRSVNAAGDINGDGFDDIVISSTNAESGGNPFAGRSYVVFGNPTFDATVELATLNGANGFKILGADADDYSGQSVSSAGDINGDGFGDLLISAPNAGAAGRDYSGVTYLLFGKARGFDPRLNLATFDRNDGFIITGAASGDYAGAAVAAAGDFNGDGLDDLVIGAYGADPNGESSGAAYIFFGSATRIDPTVDLATLDSSQGIRIGGESSEDFFGSAVAGGGDINGDGFDDVIIGAEGADPNGTSSGAAYVIFGHVALAPALELADLDGRTGFKIAGENSADSFGASVAAAGDVNGDGLDDVIIGAYAADPHGMSSGSAYLIFGAAGTFPPTIDLTTLSGSNGFAINGSVAGENAGVAVGGAGDVNNDGFDDLILGAAGAAPNGALSGAAYLIFGRDPRPALSVGDASVIEGDTGSVALAFPVTLDVPASTHLSVSFTTNDGSASSSTDFELPSSAALSFEPGETAGSVFVRVNADTTIEAHETFAVTLSTPVNAIIRDGTAEGTILNDDAALRIQPVSVAEGNSGTREIEFTVVLEQPSALPVSVAFVSADQTATAGRDYLPLLPGILSFAPGEVARTISLQVLGDTETEPDETFTATLLNPINAHLATPSALGLILNDDTQVRINDMALAEGNRGTQPFALTVSLSSAHSEIVTVSFSAADGSAIGSVDYAAVIPGVLTFAPGETTQTIDAVVLGDFVVERNETFVVTLSAATNAEIVDSLGVVTILDDDITIQAKRKAVFTDVDGDLIKVTVRGGGAFTAETFTLVPMGAGVQLAAVNLRGATAFSGADLRIAAKENGGDGRVNVAFIDAAGIDLGNVFVEGVLGRIDVGNRDLRTPGLLKLAAGSLGRAPTGDLNTDSLQSTIQGDLKKAILSGGMEDAFLEVTGQIRALKIRGNVVGSTIHSELAIQSLTIAGDFAASDNAGATISALGNARRVRDGDVTAMRSLFVGGSVDGAQFLAGFDRTGVLVNGNAGIGSVTVRGDWIASDLVAGVAPGADGMFGTEDDALLDVVDRAVARIATIVIDGAIRGSANGDERFGIVAEEIVAIETAATGITLLRGARNDTASVPLSADGAVVLREIAS